MPDADTLFITLSNGGLSPGPSSVDSVAEVLAGWPGISSVCVMTPVTADSAQIHFSGIVIQVEFISADQLSSALSYAELCEPFASCLSAVALSHGSDVSFQCMRRYSLLQDVAKADLRFAANHIVFLVQYFGYAQDASAWHEYFDRVHLPIISRLPGAALARSFRPASCHGILLPWSEDGALQRNELSFESIASFTEAMESPVLAEVRADAAKFPEHTAGPVRQLMNARYFSNS